MRTRFRGKPLGAWIFGLVLAAAGSASAAPPTSYNVSVLATLDVYSGVNDVWGYTAPNGVELAIYGHTTGTSFVDATIPASPVEIFHLPGPGSTWRDIKTYLNYAYIVTEGAGAGTGMQIVDLTDPLAPVHVGTYTGSGFETAHNLWIDTGAAVAYACGADGGGMNILSLADPENPVQLDYFNQFYIHDLYVSDGLAYAGAISSGTLRILDVSNPSNPVTLATHGYSGAATHNAWPTADGTHCTTSDETGGGHLKIWDITNLGSISLASEFLVTTETAIIHNCLLRDDMAYLSYYGAGTRIVDVTDPGNPVEVGYYDTSGQSGFQGNWGVYPFRGDDVIYSSDRQNGLFILEFTGGFAGEIAGTVRDAASTAALDSAHVKIAEVLELATDGAGAFGGFISGGSYAVVTERFGYESDTSVVVVPENGVVVHDVDLAPLPSGAVELTIVAAGSGSPVADARAEVLGTPVVGLSSDGSGQLTIAALPVGMPWTVRIGKFGHALTDVVVIASETGPEQVLVELAPGFTDDFESDQAWTAGAPDDDATDGIWERAIPVGSFWLGPVGPGEDASPTGEGYAFVTENHNGGFVGVSDVDNGKTTLLSPVFDGTGLGDLTLTYQRWFSNRAPDQGTDEFRTDVSTDGGTSWTNVETLDFGTDSWSLVQVDLAAEVGVSSTMRIRFVAEDLAPGNYVEAGVDDVEILSPATGAPGVGVPTAIGLALSSPFPNPFAEATMIAFELPSPAPVSLELFDVNGRRVTTLFAGERVAAGSHRTRWSGRDAAGNRVAPGVYFARLVTPDGTRSRKLTLLR